MRQGNRHDGIEVMLLLPLRFGNAGRFGKPDPFIAINGNGQAARAIVAKEFFDNNLRSRGRLRVKPLSGPFHKYAHVFFRLPARSGVLVGDPGVA